MKYLKTYDEKCIGCNTCMTVCSNLFFKEDNYEKSSIQVFQDKEENFQISVCNQCQACVEECPTSALSVNKFGIVMINKNLCNGCFKCVEVCPTHNMMKVEDSEIPFKCTVCGACARECPAEALEAVTQ